MMLITEHRLRHLPVLDEGNLIGLISIGDLVKDIISEQNSSSSSSSTTPESRVKNALIVLRTKHYRLDRALREEGGLRWI